MTRLRSQSSGPAAVKPRTKQLVAAAGAGLIAAAAVTVIGLGRADQSESMDRPAPSTSAAAAQTRASTSTFDDAAAERETQRRWGLKDIRVVTGAMNDVLSKYPSSDGGGTYDRDTLTFTQWIVETDDAAELRSALRTAFDTTAGESNLKLKFATAAKSINTLEQLGSDLSTAARNDDTWPRDLPLTGAPDLPTGTYRIDAGNRADDPDVIAYFDKHWPNQITLTNTQPAQPEAEGRRSDSPSNGWNGGVAMCTKNSGEPCNNSSYPDRAGCTGGFSYIRNGQRGMLTAGHCVRSLTSHPAAPLSEFGWRRYSDPRYTIGHNGTAEWTAGSDSAVIRQDTYSYRNWIWIGGRYGTEEREITAVEYWPQLGDEVYFSGGNTGWQGGAVAASYVSHCSDLPTRYVSGLETMGGDSGSPVVMQNTDSSPTGDYKAAGIHVCGPADALEPGWRHMVIMGTINSTLGGYPATW